MKLVELAKRMFFHPQLVELVKNPREYLRRILVVKDISYGTFIGTDKYGNRYYENKERPYGRNRFVIYYYDNAVYIESTRVHPEWYRWIHYTTDIPPKSYHLSEEPYCIADENKTFSKDAYIPYSTQKPRMKEWDGATKNIAPK